MDFDEDAADEEIFDAYEKWANGEERWDIPGDLAFRAGWVAALKHRDDTQ